MVSVVVDESATVVESGSMPISLKQSVCIIIKVTFTCCVRHRYRNSC